LNCPGVVADDHALAQEAVILNAAPQRAVSSDQHGVGIDLESGDAEFFQMRGPCRLIGEATIGMRGKARSAARVTLPHNPWWVDHVPPIESFR
jgi:hypothetical protein